MSHIIEKEEVKYFAYLDITSPSYWRHKDPPVLHSLSHTFVKGFPQKNWNFGWSLSVVWSLKSFWAISQIYQGSQKRKKLPFRRRSFFPIFISLKIPGNNPISARPSKLILWWRCKMCDKKSELQFVINCYVKITSREAEKILTRFSEGDIYSLIS